MRNTFLVGLILAACGAPARPGGEADGGVGTDGPGNPFYDGGATPDGAPLAEVCDDGLDNDGNGLVDDLCPCTLGDSQPCFPGAEAERGVGACHDGEQQCLGDPSGEFGEWGPCEGAVTATAEVCDSGLVDEDCSGAANEGCECVPGTTEACGSATPPCTPGTRACGTDGVWGDCLGGVAPTLETCNGINDDCDAETDEGCSCLDGQTMPCGPSGGLCVQGTQTCSGGMWGMCMGGTGPQPEICNNGLDENCNGNADDVCSPPVVTCSAAISRPVLSTVTVSGTASDPDGGTVTYLWTVTARPTGSTSLPTSPTSASTNFFLDLAGNYTLTLTVTDEEGATASCSVSITATAGGGILAQVAWNTEYGDVDLHMILPGYGPAGYWYRSEYDCFYGNTAAAWPPMGPDGNATLDIDDTNGYGPENISVDIPSDGTYAVGVAFYCSHSVQKNPGTPITPGDGPNTATVNVYCGGAMIASYSVSMDRTGRFVDLARVTWPGCAGMSVNDRTWTALVQPTAYTQPLHCPLPCTGNADCGGGERCNTSTGYCILD